MSGRVAPRSTAPMVAGDSKILMLARAAKKPVKTKPPARWLGRVILVVVSYE